MNIPADVIEQINHCLWSEVDRGPDVEPSPVFRCTLKGHTGPCRLACGECPDYEKFPERFDQ